MYMHSELLGLLHVYIRELKIDWIGEEHVHAFHI